MSDTVFQRAFSLYVKDQREAWQYQQGQSSPPSLTLENWMKYSSYDTIQKYSQLARESLEPKKTTAEINHEHAIELRSAPTHVNKIGGER